MNTGNEDRELLEMAAKAAGMQGCVVEYDDRLVFLEDGKPASIEWNPLTSDVDALRLAVKLCMQVECNRGYQHVSVYGRDGVFSEQHDGYDPYAATRRAIVRAAAAIGEAA